MVRRRIDRLRRKAPEPVEDKTQLVIDHCNAVMKFIDDGDLVDGHNGMMPRGGIDNFWVVMEVKDTFTYITAPAWEAPPGPFNCEDAYKLAAEIKDVFEKLGE